jgi:phenylacetate-coenzyme A ligase PaaK-like adenylate-forming protein
MMQFNFRGRLQNVNGYGDQPFNFLDSEAQRAIGHIASIDLIENGDKAARENWQRKQLGNLTSHAYVRSEFWRSRIPSGVGRHDILSNMPVLTRKDLAAQVQKEGSLYGDKRHRAILNYETTGSTGTPLKVFLSEQNGYYNVIRSLAQFFFDDLPLDENRVQIMPVWSSRELQKNSGLRSAEPEWAGPLSKIYRNGSNKTLSFNKDVAGILQELSKAPVGYLVCHSRVVEQLLDHAGPEVIKGLGIKVWIHVSDYRSRDVVQQLKQIGVPSLSNYSSGEVGGIAFECRTNEGYFHVAHSNVIVECDERLTTTFDGETVGRLLITHLHSYATPIIRYDVGDFGKLHAQCPCGHDGPTLSHIFGRGKHFLRHPDGKYLPFYLSTRLIREVVDFKECRFRQDAVDTITVQIGGRNTLSPEEEERLRATIIAATDSVFKVVIKPVKEIDWSDNPKQLLFSSSVT